MKRPTINVLTYLIDDDQDFINVIDEYFKLKGVKNYKLYTDPVLMLQEVNGDVAVCIVDYRISTAVTGIDLIKEVKKSNPTCFFIVMSGLLDKNLIAQCVNAGTNKILFKDDPLFMEHLVEFINEGIDTVQERFDFYSQVWERFIETDQLFEKLLR